MAAGGAPEVDATAPGLDPFAARVLAMARATRSDSLPDVAHRRAALTALAAFADEPCEAVTQDDITLEGAAGPLAARLFTPRRAWHGPRMLFLHGGGWTAGGFATHSGLCGRLAAASKTQVCLFDYPLAPEHPFPAALEAAAAALQALHQRHGGNLVLAGDSAGGTLALALAGLAQERALAPLARLLLISPITDVARLAASRRARATGWLIEADVIEDDLGHYLRGSTPRDDPRVSPLLRRSFAGFPPVHLHLAGFDPFLDEGEVLGQRLKAEGVPLHRTLHQGMIHYFWCLARAIPYARTAAEAMGARLRADLDGAI
ncbi:MAG: alpha/beta hydrolase [Hyphomicrobiales bacterium]|nr:alpha/beta hydrolase [Hyphomicrobiales bacterium]